MFSEKSTIGKLVVDDTFFCYTLEDKDRYLETNPDGKVYGETAIPRGKYQVVIDYSQRFKRELPRLLHVPGFEGVRIHPGNYAGKETFFRTLSAAEVKVTPTSAEVFWVVEG